MPNFDFARYVWRRDDELPNRVKREAGGGELIEDVWNVYNFGEQNLFVGVYARFKETIGPEDLLLLARKAWGSLRWDVPTVAAKILHEPGSQGLPIPYIVYDAASSNDEVAAWAESTVKPQLGFKDLDELRYCVGQEPLPSRDLLPQTYVYITPFSSTEYGFLFHTSHVTFDGSGIKILATRFFEHLSLYLSNANYESRESSRLKWGQEERNLLPCPTEILREFEPADVEGKDGKIMKMAIPKEFREGKPYDDNLEVVVNDLAIGRPLAHPFKSFIQPAYDPCQTPPKTRRASHRFTKEESDRIIAAGYNQKLHERLTVNHLALGALSLLPIFDNPPEEDSKGIVFYYGIADTRRRMTHRYRGALDYPGYSLGMSPIQFPIAQIQSLVRTVDGDEKQLVLGMATMAQKEYQRQAAYPSLCAIHYELIEELLKLLPPPPWCGPSFSGDGRGSKYLCPSYPIDGPAAVEITDYFLGLNKTDPAPFFRVLEWNGRIMLSADYNELAVEPNVVEGWIERWAQLLLRASE